MKTLKLMAELWPLVIGVIGVIAAGAVLFYQVREHKLTLEKHGQLLAELADVDQVVRGRLYKSDGMTIFMPRSACDQCRADCHAQMVDKFESIAKLFNARFDTIEALLKPGRN